MKKIYYLLVLTLCCSSFGFGQTTLYNETFTGQNGKGTTGGFFGPSTNVSGITTWTINTDNANTINIGFFGSSDNYFKVVNEKFEAKSLGGPAIWTSSIINISGYTNVTLTLDAFTSNTLENSDTFVTQYSINGGTWTVAANNGNLSNDFNLVVSQAGLVGSTLQVRITTNNNSSNEVHTFDNVKVVGTIPTCTPPTTQATNYSTTNINSPAIGNATLNWTRGNGNRVLVVMRAGAAVTTDPTNNVSYSANAVFGNGQELGSGNFVVYNGLSTSSTVTVTGLAENTSYHVAVYEFNNTGMCYKKPPLRGNFTVPCVTPINVTALTPTAGNQQVALTWTNSACFDEILVVAKAGSAVTAVPTGNGTGYTANSFFGVGTEIATDEFVVYKDTGAAVTTTNLTNGTQYFFKVFTRKGTLWSSGVATNETPILSYCMPPANPIQYGTSIRAVSFGNTPYAPTPEKISNVDPRYQDYTSQSTTVTKGTTSNLTVQIDTDGPYNVYTYAWIDWNQDGDFEDAGETYDLGNTYNANPGPTANSPLAIAIPTDAPIGNTRIRILCQYYSGAIPTNGPCDGSTDGEVEDYTVNVVGSVNYVFDLGVWSPADPNGIATSSDNINVLQGNAIISTNTAVGNVIVNSLAALTVNSGVVLEVAGAINMESTNLSYSSLMADGAIIGTINYDRHINGGTGVGIGAGANDLISSPLNSNQNFGEFALINGNIKFNPNPGMDTQKLFGPFLKPDGTYLLWDSVDDAGETILPGVGYRSASTDNLGFLFTGTVNQGIVTHDILYSTAPGATFKQWNLVGNPYPAYINVGEFLNYEVATGVTNADLLENTGTAIYGYDGDADNGWTIWNLNTPTRNITPGQGFFVKADPAMVAAHDLTFAPSMRVIGNTDDFIPGRMANPNNSHLKLGALIGSANYHTDFYFNDNSTSGLDRGYDAAVYGNTATSKAIYSRLVENSTGIDMGIQSLATTALGSDIVVPLGINAPQGQQVTVSIAESDLPADIAVYLEDNVTGTFTLLNDSDYVFTPIATLNSTGRFFLRFSDQTLSTPDNAIGALQIYTTSAPRALFVKGQLDGTTSITMYDVQGRVVLSSQLEPSSNLNQVDVSNLSSGVYVVKISNSSQQKTQKVILK